MSIKSGFIIYCHLFEAGFTGIIVTSKALYQDMIEALTKHGLPCIYIDVEDLGMYNSKWRPQALLELLATA